MLKIPVAQWIANAAACLCGRHGDVTTQAQHAGCSRQSADDQARKVHAAVAAEHAGGPTRQHLLDPIQALRPENTQLWAWLEQTLDFPEAKRQQFTVTAAAMGLSLNQIAAMYQVNKSTISRRMAKARELLLERTRAQLERTLELPASELDSLLEQLGPKLDLSLSSVLAPST